ncbi:MAG: TfuA-like protein [Dongiaceae bacterium]
MTRAAVFAGPTLFQERSRPAGSITWLPPAGQGDLCRAVRAGFAVIGLVDGLFETGPAVQHKEILWAMSRGVHVLGAASMGALRAAELAEYGMVGIGQIYLDFRLGRLERDDEVAVLHAPAELGFRPLTEAMVDIRATLQRALAAKIVSPGLAERMISTGEQMFFKDRRWEDLLAAAADRRRAASLARLRAWLPDNRVSLKRRDALEMVAAVGQLLKGNRSPHRPSFIFQRTADWNTLLKAARRSSALGEDGAAPGSR